jgi:hypothetical protein
MNIVNEADDEKLVQHFAANTKMKPWFSAFLREMQEIREAKEHFLQTG